MGNWTSADNWRCAATCSLCRHCRRFIRQMRLTQATVRHLPEGQGPELDRLAAHLRIAQGRRAALSRGILDTEAAARDSWAAAFRFRYPAWANRTRPGDGWLSLPRDEVEECGWAWRISLRDMHPTEGRQSVSLGEHPKLRRTPGTWRISPTDISSRGNP